jgi:hypothetical protein
MEIRANSKLFEVFKAYPQLEKIVMSIAPPFQNLKNPILRKTVGKLATIEKIARIGDIEVTELLNRLRTAVGQSEIEVTAESTVQLKEGEPDWITAEPRETIDGTEMLGRGEHPLQRVNQQMHALKTGEFLLLKTNFKPLPMIDEMTKQKYEVYSTTAKDHPDQHLTFIRK